MHDLIHFEFLGECLNLTVAQMVFNRDACFPDITADGMQAMGICIENSY